ncbi:IS110 family transposase [Candidatus Bandiella numerosa]|uniref:IS110 family transposase n=1 Tax=Candidatus Bandiella numerosa TaxID=2570586 RepID=UPI0039775212
MCIKSFAKSKLISTKTDAVDALIIAQYANITELISYKPKYAAFKELKSLQHKEHVPKSVISTWKKLLMKLPCYIFI